MAKREYRGQRSADSFVKFVQEQTTDSVSEFNDLNDIQDMDGTKRYIIGYFEAKESDEYSVFRRVASNLKDDCVFLAGFGDVSFHKFKYIYIHFMSNFVNMSRFQGRCILPASL